MAGHKNRRLARARAAEEERNRALRMGATPEQAQSAAEIVGDQMTKAMTPMYKRKAQATMARHGSTIGGVGALAGTVIGAVYPPLGAAVIAAAATAKAIGVKQEKDLARRTDKRGLYGSIYNGLPGNSMAGAQAFINSRLAELNNLIKEYQQGVSAKWSAYSLTKLAEKIKVSEKALLDAQKRWTPPAEKPKEPAGKKTPYVKKAAPALDRAIGWFQGANRTGWHNGIIARLSDWWGRIRNRPEKGTEPPMTAAISVNGRLCSRPRNL